MRRPPLLLALASLLAPVLLAQAPEPTPEPSPTPPPAAELPGMPTPAQAEEEPPPAEGTPAPGTGTEAAPPAGTPPAAETAAPPPAPDNCSLDEPCVRADAAGAEKGRSWFRGFVDLRAGDLRIQADEVETEDRPTPKGPARILHARGNVVFMKGDERLAGDVMEMDLSSGKGTLENASGYLQPGVFVEGKKVERLDADSYRIEGGRFTSCAQPNPRWAFSASWARLDLDKKITAANVVFKVKQVPALYFPYLVYPIDGKGRSTGLLFPNIGYSSLKGFTIGTGFFWAMGRSLDQTLYADNYSKIGFGLGHELRYALDQPSHGSFRTYALKPKEGGDWDYDLDWNAMQVLPGRARATLTVRQFSNLLFQRQFQDSLNLATTRTKRIVFNAQKNVGSTQLRLFAETQDTFFTALTRINRRLPGLSASRTLKRVGRSGLLFGFDARVERLQLGAEAIDGSGQVLPPAYMRYDVGPELSVPITWSFLQITPRVGARYTRYGSSDGEDGPLTGPSVDRPYGQAAVEIVGPKFSRVFENEGGPYSDKFKHVIGPEVTWTYRTKVEDFDLIPKFDYLDQLLGTHQVDYALVQDFFAKRTGPGGKSVPYRFLTWTLRQSYYVDIAAGQNEFDPNYQSSAFGPGGVPDHNSPIQSRFRFRPTPQVATDFNMEYDVNFKQTRSLGVAANFSGGWGNLGGNWSRVLRLSQAAAGREASRDTVRAAGSLRVLPDRLTLAGGADWDLFNKRLLSARANLRYDVQCCGFMVEYIRYKLNLRDESQFRFSIELANIGSMGNFLADDVNRAGAAYR